MNISRDNYEIFLIDYIDGNLTADQRNAVESFLLLNPDLHREIEHLSNHVLIPQSLKYEDKILLKKSDYSSVGFNNEFDYLCVASVEGDLNSHESTKLNHLIFDNNSLRTEYDYFHKTKLRPNAKVIFQQKVNLKRFAIFGFNRMQIISFSSAAALLLLLFGLFNIFSDDVNTKNTSPIVYKIEAHPNSYFPELPYEIIPPKLEANINVSDVPSVPVEESAKMNRDKSRSETPFGKEDVNRATIAYLEVTKLPSITLFSKTAEIKLPPLKLKEMVENNAQIVHSSSSTHRVVGLYDLVELGVNWLGKASGTDLKLGSENDQEGELKRIQLESGFFALSVPVNRKK